MGEKMNAYPISVGNPEGKRQLGRSRHRWEDNIQMDLRMVWTDTAEDRDQWRALVDTVMNFRVP
jgi:hypothetical protein